MREESCLTCKYFKSEEHDDVGFCHRYPPVFIGRENNDDIERSCPYDMAPKFQFPALSYVHFCGEYKERIS